MFSCELQSLPFARPQKGGVRKHFDPANILDSILSGSITIFRLALLDSLGKPFAAPRPSGNNTSTAWDAPRSAFCLASELTVCNFGTGDRWRLGPEVIATSFFGHLNEETTTKVYPASC